MTFEGKDYWQRLLFSVRSAGNLHRIFNKNNPKAETMVRTMSHEEWLEAAGQLAAVLWHLQKAGLEEVIEYLYAARFLLEEEQNPIGAGRKLAEAAEKLRQEPGLTARLAQYEQGLPRHPKVLIRLSQLTAQWLECPTIEGRPYPSLARTYA